MYRILLTAALLAASGARAAPVVEVRVAYGDLDVAAKADARTLMDRIARAAAAACAPRPGDLARDEAARFDHCRIEAFGRAVSRLDPSILAAVSEYSPSAPDAAR